MAIANAINAQTAGIQGMTSLGVWTGSSVTENALLIGGATINTISNVTPANNSIALTDGSGVPSLGTSLSNDFTFTKATSGATTTLTVSNTSNTASSAANILAQVAGGTAADATHQAAISGGQAWTWGLDNSDSDAFVVASSASLGTTNVMRVATSGEINFPLQPAFLANLSATVTDVTGDGTTYTILYNVERFDQNGDFNTGTGIFTAPVTGKYSLSFVVSLDQLAAGHTSLLIQIVTSNLSNIQAVRFNPAPIATGPTNVNGTLLCDMDAADTARINVTVSGSTKVVDVVGTTGGGSFFSGYLAC